MSAQLKHRVVETAVEELTIPIKSAPYNKDNVMKAVDNSVLLRVENISKKFPGTLALDNVSLDINRGEVHVLFGENGAGKSTLIQIIAGVHRPTKGKIFLDGQEVELHTVHQARNLGISAVFQEFSIIPQLTVGENLFLVHL
jgi:ribose transport system ATP-binding protein